jgi:hypothetical protein
MVTLPISSTGGHPMGVLIQLISAIVSLLVLLVKLTFRLLFLTVRLISGLFGRR